MSKFDTVLERRVTRGEFLKTLGAALLAIFGIAALLGVLSGKHFEKAGFGSGAYGRGSDL